VANSLGALFDANALQVGVQSAAALFARADAQFVLDSAPT